MEIHAERFLKTMEMTGKLLVGQEVTRAMCEEELEIMAKDAIDENVFDASHCPIFSVIQGNMLASHGNGVKASADLHGLLYWVKNGRKVYRISEGLTAELSATEVSGIWKYVKPPFKTIYVQPGSTLAEFKGSSIVGKDFCDKIVGYYLIDKPEGLSVIGMAIDDKADVSVMHSWFRVLIKTEWLENEGGKIDLDIVLDAFEKDEETQIGTHIQYDRETLREMITFPINVLLYLSSDRPEVSAEHQHGQDVVNAIQRTGKAKKVRALKRQLDGISRLSHYDVGKSIKVDRSVPVTRDLIGTGRTFKYTHRFSVSGHWRWQMCGEGKTDLRHVRVRPHFKGPDMAEVIHKQYEVEKKN